MQAKLLNTKGSIVGTVDLPERVFAAGWNPDLVHQVAVAEGVNRRQLSAHAKGRGEVRGGGKKPWRQKGTGRARHGSIRSPIWKGGGVSHGPDKNRVFKATITKKMRIAALHSLLSKKLTENEILVIDSLSLGAPKTKELYGVLAGLLGKDRAATKKLSAVLVAPHGEGSMVHRASTNIPKVKAVPPKNISVSDLLSHKNVVLVSKAISELA
jgi:large subunit ribosomal protein L4